MFSPIANNSSSQFILEGDGDLVYYKNIPTMRSLDFKKHLNGKISYFNSAALGFVVLDSLFNAIDTIKTNGFITDPHELLILHNGNYLLLGFENSTIDLSSEHLFLHNESAGSHNANLKSAVIQVLDPSKNVVFTWHAKTHFSFDSADPFWLTDTSLVDWTHSNALELDADSNILLSSRHFNEITKINSTTGDLMWRFGGKYNQFTFTSDTIPFYGQHDIRRLSNGNITLFDNGNYFTPHTARALEYKLDEHELKAELVWSYINYSTGFSNAMGNVQRLPNKLTLINYGNINSNNICFNLVDSLGADIFNIKFNNSLFSYRSHYYPSLPLNVQRPVISCFDSSGVKYLRADNRFNNYQWNTGSTSAIIQVTANGKYIISVPYGQLASLFSEPVVISDINKYCDFTSIGNVNINQYNLLLYPNPTSNVLNICFQKSNLTEMLMFYDIAGKQISLKEKTNNNKNLYSFDTSDLEAGLYFISINKKIYKFIKD